MRKTKKWDDCWEEKTAGTKKCRSCVHRATISPLGTKGTNHIICLYILDNGVSRPCNPGDDCTEYKRGKQRNRAKFVYQ